MPSPALSKPPPAMSPSGVSLATVARAVWAKAPIDNVATAPTHALRNERLCFTWRPPLLRLKCGRTDESLRPINRHKVTSNAGGVEAMRPQVALLKLAQLGRGCV